MLDSLFSGLAGLVAFYYELVPSYAFAIVMLTLTVMAVTTPFTWKSTRSMLALQRFQPEMKKIQEQYKHDRQKLNEELMAFYKEHKINPVGGCLPMLIQMPIFIVLYQVIFGLSRVVGGNPSPKYISKSSALYEALVDAGGRMFSFGIDLSKSASSKGLDPGQRFPLYLMVAATVITQYIQTKRMSSRNSQAGANPQMQMMNRIMPAFFGFIALNMPGGVITYFIVSNLFRIAQQELMYKFDPMLAEHAENERQKIREAKATRIETKSKQTKQAKEERRTRPGSPPPPSTSNGQAHHGRATPKRPKKGR